MKRKLIAWCIAVLLSLMTPVSLLAASEDENQALDIRLEGYTSNVTLPPKATALTWLLLVAMGAVCIGVLFKDARRTHLD